MLEIGAAQVPQALSAARRLPVIDWHRSVKDFFRTKDMGGEWDTRFIHADEAETSVGLLFFPEMVDMS